MFWENSCISGEFIFVQVIYFTSLYMYIPNKICTFTLLLLSTLRLEVGPIYVKSEIWRIKSYSLKNKNEVIMFRVIKSLNLMRIKSKCFEIKSKNGTRLKSSCFKKKVQCSYNK